MSAGEGAGRPRDAGPRLVGDRAGDEAPADWRREPLYAAFYGVHEPPFDLTPNPRYLFLTERHREALSMLRYGLATAKGFTLILGEAGTGKTTLIRTALAQLGQPASRFVMLNNPTLSRHEFYDTLARELGLSEEARGSKSHFLAELQQSVEARYATGGLTGLIIDEAQSLPHDLLEDIRLLGNIETTTTKLLNIVLCGQPELADRLNDVSLRQLKQRVALRCELSPLTLQEAASYISGRLRIAGGAPADVFTRETVMALYERSRGIPRTINVLCDNALIAGFAAQAKPITLEIVEEVCRDFDVAATGTARKPVPETRASDEPTAPEARPAVLGTPKPPPRTPPEARKAPAERPMFSDLAPERKWRFRLFR